MRTDHLSTPPQPIADQRTRPALGRLAGPLAALALATLMTTVSVAAITTTDPDWHGTTPEEVSFSPENRAWQPDIGIDSSGKLVIVWSEKRSEIRNIYFTERALGNWTTSQVVSATASPSQYPDVLAVGDDIFVAWVDGTASTAIYEAKKTASTPWGARLIPSSGSDGTTVRLASSTGRLHAVFNDYDNLNIYHTSRALSTGSWPAATPIYTATAWGAWFPALATGPDGQTLHAVWQDQTATLLLVTYMSGTVSGDSVDWAPAITLSTGITESLHPDVAVDPGGNVHVVWGEQGAGGQAEQYVRYTRYDKSAGSWSPSVRIDSLPVQVNTDNPTYIAPTLALGEEDGQVTVCVAWYGFRAGDSQAEDILLRCSQDGGNDWTGTTRNVSRSPDTLEWGIISFLPAATFDQNGWLHLVWQERVGSSAVSDYEIYYSGDQNHVYLPLIMRNG